MRRNPVGALAGLLLLLAPAGLPAAETNRAEVDRVDVDGAAELLEREDGIVVLDVRTPGEFEAAHIAGATNIDIGDAAFRTEAAKLDRAAPYLVHCAAGIPGGRSERSVAILRELGFEKIYHLDGGINAWKAAGRPYEGSTKEQPPG